MQRVAAAMLHTHKDHQTRQPVQNLHISIAVVPSKRPRVKIADQVFKMEGSKGSNNNYVAAQPLPSLLYQHSTIGA
jgi:hypothetical protein